VGLFPRVLAGKKRWKDEADRLSPYTTEVKNELSYISDLPVCLMACTGQHYPGHLFLESTTACDHCEEETVYLSVDKEALRPYHV